MTLRIRRGGWGIDNLAWKQLSKLLEPFSGGKVQLLPAQRDLVPPQPGVYFICLAPMAASQTVLSRFFDAVYVGQAVNLRQRFKQHVDGTTSIRDVLREFPNALEFYFVEVPVENLNVIEKRCFDVIGPSENRISPPMRATLLEPVSVNP